MTSAFVLMLLVLSLVAGGWLLVGIARSGGNNAVSLEGRMRAITNSMNTVDTPSDMHVMQPSMLVDAGRWVVLALLLAAWSAFYLLVLSAMPAVVLLLPYAVVALLVAVDILRTLLTRYEFTPNRVTVKTGILMRRVYSMEVFRIQNVTCDQPIWLVPFGVGTVTVYSPDETFPVMVLPGVKNAVAARELLTQMMLDARTRRGVGEFVAL